MKRTLIFYLILILFSGFSCKKEEKQAPVCMITNLQDNQEFFEDEDIQVNVSVDDKNSVITSVLLYIDNKSFTGTSEFPYNFTIKAGDLTPGTYTIKAIVRNIDGKQGESSVKIFVKEVALDFESPDFVSFSDGKLPKGWEADGWYISPNYSYDDFFSLFSNQGNSIVKVFKTCNYFEFYYSGESRFNLYIDGELWETIISINPPPTSWKKYAGTCPDGFHVFEWKLVAWGYQNCYLDAIKFETKTD